MKDLPPEIKIIEMIDKAIEINTQKDILINNSYEFIQSIVSSFFIILFLEAILSVLNLLFNVDITFYIEIKIVIAIVFATTIFILQKSDIKKELNNLENKITEEIKPYIELEKTSISRKKSKNITELTKKALVDAELLEFLITTNKNENIKKSIIQKLETKKFFTILCEDKKLLTIINNLEKNSTNKKLIEKVYKYLTEKEEKEKMQKLIDKECGNNIQIS